MVQIRVIDAPAFWALGRKTRIAGPDSEAFGVFWRQAREGGWLGELRRLAGGAPGEVTRASVLGLSDVSERPEVRSFDFFIAAETREPLATNGWETIRVPAARWAVFENRGPLPQALLEAEMLAFREWLPASGLRHAHAPELEVYPAADPEAVEFWLPVEAAGPESKESVSGSR